MPNLLVVPLRVLTKTPSCFIVIFHRDLKNIDPILGYSANSKRVPNAKTQEKIVRLNMRTCVLVRELV